MRRGDIWWVSFDPSLHSEIKKTRPAIIVSNDHFNEFSSRIQVIPLTSQLNKLYPSECYLWVNKQQSKAMVDQISTVDKRRLSKKITTASPEDVKALEKIIKKHLSIK
ncbi:MAG: type II toxin-antitoxin system PemK/MazF family toxin [Candidatus Gracilibacteria bacterium]|nr:type II toxin-antitoxin system PemK/MazF family toxin [Candidatus Gracilibacteria bacterium]